MKQIIAIFTKDARRFWPEILVSLALLVALAFVYPQTWRMPEALYAMSSSRFVFPGGPMDFLAECLIVLVPMSWWIMITRLVHCERLVGSTQFWITRPYEWPKVIAAKVLFLAAFLYGPFLIAHCVLLLEGGFHPLIHLPGLLVNIFFLTAIVILPLAALSALTTGFGRMTLLLLAVILFALVIAAFSSALPDLTGTVPDILSGDLALAVLVVGCSAIVVVQYARRRLKLAWFLAGAVAVLLCVMGFFSPDPALMNRYYPMERAGAATPVQFDYAASGLRQPMAHGTERDAYEISIPVRVSGVAEGDAVIPVGLKARIQGSGGTPWQSLWQIIGGQRYVQETSETIVNFRIPRVVYERFKSAPVTLHLTFALAQAHQVAATAIPLPPGEFSVPGFGVCTPKSWFGRPGEFSQIDCRSAMNQPRLTYVTTQWSEGHCPDAPGKDSKGLAATAWAGRLDPGPAEFGITSVWSVPVNLSNPWIEKRNPGPRSLCPGTSISFAEYQGVAHMQTTFEIRNFRLPELSLGDMYMVRPGD